MPRPPRAREPAEGRAAYRRAQSFAPQANNTRVRREVSRSPSRPSRVGSSRCGSAAGGSASSGSFARVPARSDESLGTSASVVVGVDGGGGSGTPSLVSGATTVDAALAEWAQAERLAGASLPAAASLPGSRVQLEAEIVRLRRELAAARRGAHVSERVDTEMRRVKRLWQESEHRLLVLQSELRTAQVTQRTMAADLKHAELDLQSQSERIRELEHAARLSSSMLRERSDALDAAREAEHAQRATVGQLQLQLVATAVSSEALTSEVQLLERSAAEAVEETSTLLSKLHASALERADQHRAQLALWEKRASDLLEAGPTAKLDLVMMQGNADIFERFRSLLHEQRANCDHEGALLRGWLTRTDGRVRREMSAQVAGLRQQLDDVRTATAMELLVPPPPPPTHEPLLSHS